MLGISVLAALQIIIAWIQAVYSLKTNGKLAIAGNSQYMWHVLRLPMEFFSQRMAGDISARRTENAGIAEQLVSTFAPLVIQAGMMVFYLVVMLRYSWLLSLLGIASVVLNTAVSRYISRKRIDLTRVSMRDQGKLVSTMVAGIEMIESIKASGAENGYFRKWAGYQASVNASKVQFARIDAYLGSIPTVVSTLTNAGVLMGSIYLCMRGEWSVGMVSAFSSYLTMFMTPATQMINAGQTLQELRASMERIEDVLDYPTDVEYASELDEHVEYGKLGGRIEMRNVTFGYSRLAEPLIRDFNMTLEPGRKVAFVGGSGCKEHAGQADFGPVQALERRNPLRWQAHIRHQPQRVHRFGGGGRSGSDPV